MSTEAIASGGSALALAPSAAELRVQRAKARLTTHLSALDRRARALARQGAWVAGMVLLGCLGVAAAATLFGARRVPRRSGYYAYQPAGRGVGTALILTALGLLSRRLAPAAVRRR